MIIAPFLADQAESEGDRREASFVQPSEEVELKRGHSLLGRPSMMACRVASSSWALV